MTDLPAQSEIVIIGGGVVGCSVAYQLAMRGKTDVTLVERRRLTEGSTWHAAGLIGQLRSSRGLAELMRASVRIYQDLGAETGYATGWHPAGSVRLAASKARWQELRRQVELASGFGLEAHLIPTGEAADRFPLLSMAGLEGAAWVPSDGYADPSQLTHAFARGARTAGVRFIENCRVEAIRCAGRRVEEVVTGLGTLACDVVVNTTGMWGAQTAGLAGVDLAVGAIEHQYVVTEQIAGLPSDLPTLRDPDGSFYLKPENGALLVGGWEEGTRVPWPSIPRDFGPELFAANHDRFEPLAQAATHRIPAFADIGLRTWVNGPIPFTPDAEPLIGPDTDLDNLFHCCGFSAGIAAAGGAGQATSAWVIDGDPGMDMSPFDVQRFGRGPFGDLAERLVSAYAGYYRLAAP